MQQLLQEEEILTGDITSKSDDWLLQTMIQLVSNMVNAIQISGLHFYLNKELRLYKNIFYHVKILLSQNSTYIDKANLNFEINRLKNYFSGGLFDNNCAFSTLAHLEQKFYSIIILMSSTQPLKVKEVPTPVVDLMSRYIRFHIALMYIQYIDRKEPSQIFM